MLWLMSIFFVLLLTGGTYSDGNRLEAFETVDDYLNVCINGQNHKSRPGPEMSLYGVCSPYQDWSCCTSSTTRKLLTNATWYNFSWDHCGRLSDKCRRHFEKDLCFYECSPNVGPWLVQEDRTWRKERFANVPLCSSDCNAWFEDCQDDLTCVPNWSRDFVWKSGVQSCPKDDSGDLAECVRIGDMYKNAKDFCERVWDFSWKVVDESKQLCMKMNFEQYDISKNAAVARQRAAELVDEKLISRNSAVSASASAVLTVGMFLRLYLA